MAVETADWRDNVSGLPTVAGTVLLMVGWWVDGKAAMSACLGADWTVVKKVDMLVVEWVDEMVVEKVAMWGD